MGKKKEKVISAPEQKTVTHLAYVPILRGDGYGERMLDVDNCPSIFETETECKNAFTVGEDGCVAIAKVTWVETA